VTGGSTFGDFISAAHWHLDPANRAHGPAGGRGGAEEAARSLLRVVTVMRRYVDDMATAFDDVPSRTRRTLNPYARTWIQARQALASSAGYLRHHRPASRWPVSPAASPLARRLDGVTVSLATGRDLLQTHFAPGPRGTRQHRSEWAAVVSSPQATRALLAELASLGRQIARQGTDLALAGPSGAGGGQDERRRLNAACQWLWALDASVRAAHQREPVSDRDRELLRAIPVNARPPRRLPDRGDPVAALCQGVVDSAERVHHAAWLSATTESWFPGLTITSLRGVAEAATVTSHHCEVLLRSLAAWTSSPGPGGIRADLLAAADAAGRARQGWLRTAHALDGFITDMQQYSSPAALESRDLALWTGRLAYANPEWTLASGPGHAARPPEDLAQGPDDVRAVIAAVHHASHTLTRLAQADREQIRAAAGMGRILVPTRFLPDTFDIPRPFGHAPKDRVDPLLAVYQDTGQLSVETTAAVATVAEATRAPSQLLTTTSTAVDTNHDASYGDQTGGQDKMHGRDEVEVGRESRDMPGPVERTLLDLGVTSADVLQRGAEIDRASAQIIIDAAAGQTRDSRRTAPMLSRSAGTAELVNHVLASGDPRAVALLRRPVSVQREPPEPEP